MADERRQEPISYFFAKRTRSQSDQSDVVQSTDSEILSSENQVEYNSASEAEENLTVSTIQQERADLTFPEIWTVEIWEDKKKAYPWLSCESGKLGCTICSSVAKLGTFKTQIVSLLKEWCSHSVTFNGDTRKAKLSSLRKNVLSIQSRKPTKVQLKLKKVQKKNLLRQL